MGYLAERKKELEGYIEVGRLGNCLGFGIEGMVWSFGSDRVLKVVDSGRQSYVEQVKIYERLKRSKSKRVAKIYGWGRLDRGHWWVEMEKLTKIKHQPTRLAINYPAEGYSLNQDTGEMILDKSAAGFLRWYSCYLGKMGLSYTDLHSGNVMFGGGVLKLVDLEGFRINN